MVIYDNADGKHETLDLIDFLSLRGHSVWEAALYSSHERLFIEFPFHRTVKILKDDWM